MYASCKYCGRIHLVGDHCSKKPSRQYHKQYSKADKFRKTARWQKKRIEALERDHYLCRVCFPNVLNNSNVQVHHIEAINDSWDKRLDNDNLITLCPFHHRLAEEGEITKAELLEIIRIPPGEFFNFFTQNPRPTCPPQNANNSR